ncbi:MAG: hypothetical protein LBD40_01980, partial [Puniceicoccales bacterium]|nr:hypothetical protein [Puniceicoccales bacterium]
MTKLLLALGLVGMCCNHGLWAETLDEFCSTLSENGFLVPSGQEMTLQSGKDSAEKKACDFLNRQEGINPSTVLLRRYGMFTQEFRTKKQLNVNFCKHRYYHLPPKPGETITVDLRPSIMLGDRATDGRLKCAVLVLGHAQLAADECDDTSIGTLRVRSLPSGVIKSSFKDATRDGMKVKVVPTYPKDPNEREWFQIMVYAPGSPSKRPVCCVIENWILSQNDAKILSACVQDAELKEEYRKQLQAHSSLYLLDNIFDNMRGGLRAKGLLIAPLSGSGCPKWARFLRDLQATKVNEDNVAQWVEKLKSLEDAGTYLYAPNSDRGCEYHWYDHHSALARALFFPGGIPSKLVCNLRTSYVLLARQYNVSPEWIHRILVLYFAINPYKVHDFTERGVERCLPNVRDICTFFNDDCWPIVRRYCGGDVNAELIKALIDAQSTELGNWWRDFQAVIRQMNKRKAEQPDLANCFKRKVGAPALENARQEALDAAQQL